MSCDTEIERTGWESQAPNYFSPFLSLGDGRMRKREKEETRLRGWGRDVKEKGEGEEYICSKPVEL